MGQTKVSALHMGNSLRHHSGNITDPLTGMTATEKLGVRTTWGQFYKNKENAVDLFVELYRTHPETQQLFPFAKEPIEALSCNPQVIAHCVAVAGQVAAMVDALDDVGLFEELVRKNARSHANRKGVTTQHFVFLGQVMRMVMHKKLGSCMLIEADVGWEKFFKLLMIITTQVYSTIRPPPPKPPKSQHKGGRAAK
ncbi:globin-like [Ornithodoros turicata]|uniref:globin-like n=1 Tax=Ornithodoros turicata TaxID=34597 RepID=UPI00313A1369